MKDIGETIGWMIIILFTFTVVGGAIWLVKEEGYQAGRADAIKATAELCDPYLPSDPRMR